MCVARYNARARACNSALGDAERLAQLAESARGAGKHNIAFVAHLLRTRTDECLALLTASGRLPEAALFSLTYRPSQVSSMLQAWRADLATRNRKTAAALADPLEYMNLFPDLELAVRMEQSMAQSSQTLPPAADYPHRALALDVDVIEALRQADADAVHGTSSADGDADAPAPADRDPDVDAGREVDANGAAAELDAHD